MSDTANTPTPPSGEPLSASMAGTLKHLHLDGDAIDKIAELGAKAKGASAEFLFLSDPTGVPREIPFLLVQGENPKALSVKPLIEEYRIRPERRRGQAVVGDLESFIDLVNRQRTDHSVVFACSDWRAPSLTAVIDYHGQAASDEPDNGTHRIHYPFPRSEEWETWVKHHDATMTQEDFAEFVEERLPDLSVPTDAVRNWVETDLGTTIATPAKLMELSRGLQVNVNSKVKNAKMLQSGEGAIIFEEEHSGVDGTPIKVPGAFVASIPVFYGGDAIDVPARLRYRVRGPAIMWTYLLFRPDRIIAEAVDHAKADVRQETGLPVYEGKPEMSVSGAPVTAVAVQG